MHVMRRLGFGFIGFSLLFITSCAVNLAPRYDQVIADGLATLNTRAMWFFASTSFGTTSETFAQREQAYNELIGGSDALMIYSKARPMPKNSMTEKVNAYLAQRGVAALDDQAPSATALENIAKTFTKMRDTDKKQGVSGLEVAAFKGQVVIFLDQAITYENFLER